MIGGVECEDSSDPTCDVSAGTPGQDSGSKWTPGGGGGCVSEGREVPCERDGRWLGQDGCYYGPFNDDTSDLTPPDEDGDWDLYLRVCYAGDDIISAHPMWLEAGDSPVTVTPAMLAERAVSQLSLPSPSIQVSPQATQLVGLGTWLWLESDSWEPQTATATVPGLSVTATAEPARAVWSMGDGASVTCTGAGTPWSNSFDPKAESPDCGYTYSRVSAGEPSGQYAVSVTVYWAVSWQGGGQSGTVPDLTVADDTGLIVEEAQTVITR